MHKLRRISIISSICALLLVAGCGGGGDGAAAITPPANTDCVLGTSKIGECTI